MSFEWPIGRLSEHTDSCLGKMLDAQKNKGIPQPYLGNSNVRWGTFDLVDLAEMKFEPHEEERYGLEPGDLVVCEGGEPGRCAIWTGSRGMKIQKALHRIRPKATLNNYFLFYWFCHAAKTGLIEPYFTGTTIKHLSGRAVAALEVPLLPIEMQVAIAGILKSLDDRISLLRETNTTLEAIAQALFKSWFVDFDPVHAKQQGNAPQGMDAATAALFPDSFEESELGDVPKGWRILPFTETVKVIGGGTPKTSISEYWDGEIPWFSVVDAPTITDVFVIDTAKHISAEGLNKSSTKLLAEGTTIISARGTVGRLALVGREMAMNQSCYGLRGKADDAYFTYFSTYRLVESLKQRSHGSVFDTITTETMKGVFVIYPDSDVIDAFEMTLNPVMNRIKTNLEQAQTLATLRDTLLPRLMSGQLRLPE
jgi:type I restriction enzyme, S subunit